MKTSTSINVLELNIKNFRSFLGENVINFPKKGLILINGRNLDTGGSSGAGKSSIGMAIEIALGLQGRMEDGTVQNWTAEEPYEISLKLEVFGKTLEITRGKTATLEFDGQKTVGSNALVTQKLWEIISVKPELAKSLIFREQRSFGHFLQLTDSEKKNFLGCLLQLDNLEEEFSNIESGLDRYRKKVAKLELQLDTNWLTPEPVKPVLCTESIDELVGHVTSITNALTQTLAIKQAALDERTAAEKSHNDTLAALRKEATEAIAPIKAEFERWQSETPQSYTIPQSEITRGAFLRDRIAELELKAEEERNNWHNVFGKITKALADARYNVRIAKEKKTERNFLVTRKNSLLEKIELIKSGKCPTCNQFWLSSEEQIKINEDKIREIDKQIEETDKLQEKLPEMEALVEFLVKEESEISYDRKASSRIQQEIMDCRVEQEKLNSKYFQDKKDFEAAKQAVARQFGDRIDDATREIGERKLALMSKYEEIRSEFNKKIDGLVELSSKYKDQIRELKSKIEVKKTEFDFFQKQYEKELAEYKRQQSERTNAQNELDSTKKELNANEDFKEAIEGFVDRVFGEVLSEISNESNSIADQIPNISGLSVNFSGDRKTKTGKVKQEISTVLHKDGVQIPKKALSCGQQTSLELATDLAVSEIVNRRTGTDFGWVFLDECFDGHDPPTKDACLKILKRYAQDKLILVIDHTIEIKGMFDGEIVVEYQNGVSKIT